MKLAAVRNLSRPLPSAVQAVICDTFWCKLRGLMFRGDLAPGAGLLLTNESAIHMLFVRFDLAVLWLDQDLKVVDKVLAKPWRPAYMPRARAHHVLELHPERWGDFEIGDQLELAPG